MADCLSGETLLQMSSESCSPEECLQFVTSMLPRLDSYMRKSRDEPTRSLEDGLLLRIIYRALQCQSHRELVIELLAVFKDTSSIDFLVKLLHTLQPSQECTKEFNDIIRAVVELLDQLYKCMPSSFLELQGLIFALESIINKRQSFRRETKRINLVKDGIRTSLDVAQKKAVISKSYVDKRKPPDDFRNIPVFPRKEDIFLEQKPFLRKVIKDGCYEDMDHYLDVQFRLFREDCLSQLREGILEYRQLFSQGHRYIPHLENARIYNDVRILFRETSLDGIVHVLQLEHRTYSNIDWDNTKRLLHGSLVCLSFDHFETLIFATINEVDADVLAARGIFKVKIYSESNTMHENKLGSLCKMIESTALFEAYRHGLQILKTVRAGDLAFEKFIVKCEKNIGVTDYFEKNSDFDFTPITRECPVKIDYVSNIFYRPKRSSQAFSWPSAEELHMNPVQYEAFKSALTNELCLIQGPPGTGKSYLGVQIVKALLANTSAWSSGRTCPILVVCFTNHALDQFLENILKSTDKTYWNKIVRVGGKNNNSAVEDISLRKRCRRVFKKNRLLDLNQFQNLISEFSASICLLPFTIVDHIELSRHIMIPSYQFSSQEDRTIFRWLNIDKRGILDQASQKQEARGNNKIIDCLEIENNLPRNKFEKEYFNLTSTRNRSEHPDRRIQDSVTFTRGMNILDEWRTLSGNRSVQEDRLFRDQVEGVFNNTLEKNCSNDIMTSEEAAVYESGNIWELSIKDRWRLYRYWKTIYKQSLQRKIEAFQYFHDDILHAYSQDKFNSEFEVLEGARLIAMTSTGAAKYHRMLELLKPSITIIDEAAEVLEAHIIATLTSSCKHLILIGDHKQLEPKPAVFELAQKYNLSLSFFERMIRNGVPYHCLLKQHRMRPEISNMVKEIYPGLHDAETVMEYENIGGVSKNIYFLSHEFKERYDEEGRSYENKFEAEFTVGLCRYLIYQGYAPSQITVLTPYSGQLRCLTNCKDEKTKNVRFCIVDNYQGEENDIVLLSMVRSNDIGKLGFLDKENRVCVALSRARKGLYVIGNFEMMRTHAKKTKLWSNVIKKLELDECYGAEFPLFCQNHPERQIRAKRAEDFENCPDGGCKRKCETHLLCGHTCRRYCHPEDRDHKQYQCTAQCLNMCTFNHQCQENCHFPEPCICNILVEKEFSCGHVNKIECFLDPSERDCQTIVTKYFDSCEHSLEMRCCEPIEKMACVKTVERELKCGHTALLPCKRNISHWGCTELVEKTWPCSHSARIYCYEFAKAKCTKQVSRKLECGHTNFMECHENLEYFECEQEVEKVFRKCKHTRSVPCHYDIEDEICTESVVIRLPCNHEIISECFKADFDQKEVCKSVCGSLCENGHKCRRLCHFPEKCKCQQSVQKHIIKCNHSAVMECWQDPDEFSCSTMVTKELPTCGHKVLTQCSASMENFTCLELTEKYRALCGHTVILECSKDPNTSRCDFVVTKTLNCGHACECHCSDRQADVICTKPITELLSCGHEVDIPCHQLCNEDVVCKEKLDFILECGHFYPLPCHQFQSGEIPENIECITYIETILPCGHSCDMLCGSSKLDFNCRAVCGAVLSCGHECNGFCNVCSRKGYHERCEENCRKQLLCGHDCESGLCESCKVCEKQCEVCCDHKQCDKRCFELCAPCLQPCSWRCPHHKCTLLCHEICDRPRCASPCPKQLICKHECLGFCGEPCPPICRLCDSKTLKDQVNTTDTIPRLVYLPDCKHCFEFSTLDNEIKKVNPNETLMHVSCPRCSVKITWHPRYNKIIKLQQKRRNLAKALTTYLSEAKFWEFFPLFFPSLLNCKIYLEDCISFITEECEFRSQENLTEICDKALDQIRYICTIQRPSFNQYKSVYDVISRISDEWQNLVIMDRKSDENCTKEETATGFGDSIEKYSFEVSFKDDSSPWAARSTQTPTIYLMADPHVESWNICREGKYVYYDSPFVYGILKCQSKK